MIHPDAVMLTRSGQPVYPLQPQRTVILAEDISYALARTRRYAGHVDVSVLEHSVIVLRLAELSYPGNAALVAYAAAHDLVECYLGELPRDVKGATPEYGRVEGLWQQVVHTAVGLAWPPPAHLRELIRRADRRAPAVEARVWGHPHADHYEHHAGGPCTASELHVGRAVHGASAEILWMVLVAAIATHTRGRPFPDLAWAGGSTRARLTLVDGGDDPGRAA